MKDLTSASPITPTPHAVPLPDTAPAKLAKITSLGRIIPSAQGVGRMALRPGREARVHNATRPD
jgi:hypothetical protein